MWSFKHLEIPCLPHTLVNYQITLPDGADQRVSDVHTADYGFCQSLFYLS